MKPIVLSASFLWYYELGFYRNGRGRNGAKNIAAAQATCANIHRCRTTVHNHTHPLHVGSPSAVGLTVGVADIIAVQLTLFTYLTKLTHQ